MVSGPGEAFASAMAARRVQGPPPLIARVRGDSFDPAALIPGPCLAGAELAAFLGEILERSHAIPMPDLESALGVQLARFDSLADYEREVLDLSSDGDSVP